MKSGEERPFFTSRKEGERYIAESLPLQDAMILDVVLPQGEQNQFLEKVGDKVLSLVWLDMSKRPELRDLARVHATEGEGESIFTWVYIDEDKEDCYFVLNVKMQKTVRETFRFPIRMQEWAPLVEVISRTGSLSILAGPPVAWRKLLPTMEPAALLQMIYNQARGDVTLEMSVETRSELRRHYEAWVRREKQNEGGQSSTHTEPGSMARSAEFSRFLMSILTSASSFPLFLVADGEASFQVAVPREALGGNPDGPKIVFRQGRLLAQQHRQLCRNKGLLAVQISLGASSTGEVLMVSLIDQETGDLMAIPYQPVRDKQGRITNLIDTGGLVQVGGTFLPAFLLGMNTADQPEKQALQALDREMKRLAKSFVAEAQRRMGRSDN